MSKSLEEMLEEMAEKGSLEISSHKGLWTVILSLKNYDEIEESDRLKDAVQKLYERVMK